MKISAFSINRPIFTIVIMIVFLLLGALSFVNIPVKLLPDINPPVGAVSVSYSGASPTEVLQNVTKPLEENLSSLSGLKNIRSTSQEGSSLIILEFTWETSIDDAQEDIHNIIDQTDLPDESHPKFMRFDPKQMPVIQMAVTSTNNNQQIMDQIDEVTEELTKIKGIAQVHTEGRRVEKINIHLNQDELEDNQLTQQDIVDVIQGSDVSSPGEPIMIDEHQLTTRMISELTSVEEIENLIIGHDLQGEDIHLYEVGDVLKQAESDDMITRVNQEPGVLINILEETDADTLEVSKAFQERMNELFTQEQYEEMDAVIFYDQGEYIESAIRSVRQALILGCILAMVVLFFFLKNMISPLIIGVTIPFSVIITFVLIYFADFSLNLMTLGGLALGIGMLVDNAIVVIENINRHLLLTNSQKEASFKGVTEVSSAIIASTLTTILVFVPVLFISGVLENLFIELGLTISFSLFASLFTSLTVVPMMASRLLKRPKTNIENRLSFTKGMKGFEHTIRFALRHRVIVLILTVLLLTIGGYNLQHEGMEFLPVTDEGSFTIKLEYNSGVPLSVTNEMVENVENLLNDEQDIKSYVSVIGSNSLFAPLAETDTNMAEIYVTTANITKRERTTQDIVDDLSEIIKKVSGDASVNIIQNSTSGTTPNTVTFILSDTNESRLEEAINDINNSLGKLKEIKSVDHNRNKIADELHIVVNRKKAMEHGFLPIHIVETFRNVTRGTIAGQIETDAKDFLDVEVRYADEFIDNINALENLLLKKANNSYVQLSEVASIEQRSGLSVINRFDQNPAVEFTVTHNKNTTSREFSNEIEQVITGLQLSPGTTMKFTGDQDLLLDSLQDMRLILIFSVLFVYLVMAAQFESLKYPFIIIFSVPFVLIGVTVALTLTHTPLSLTAFIGFVVLIGIVVNNAIVLVTYIIQKKEEGQITNDAIVEAVKIRLRPILMTALTTILGMAPLAFGIGEGSEILQPMGITVIGGMVSSTLLTLYIIPVIYSFFER
jgi:HAE1 family hydrophobic/amphiphilic exporter-1